MRRTSRSFSRASEAIGAPVQIISGREEARLIHLGVQVRWPQPEKHVLLLDVGGGSAEVVASEDGEILYSTSIPLGAVRLTGNFLRHDPPQREEIVALEEYIEQQFAAARRRLAPPGQARAIGTSATAAAVVCAVNRIKSSDREEADGRRARSKEIRRLYSRLISLDRAGRQRIPGIGPRRAEIITAGAAVLLYFVEHFTRGALYYSAAGLRDGVIADLAAHRVAAADFTLDKERRRVVVDVARHYGVPLAHARQVAKLARSLFLGLASLHRLHVFAARCLEAAAYLHDVGHYVSSTRHHRHSYYLVANSDLPGFTDREQLIIATICRYHRKALPTGDHDEFRLLKPEERKAVLQLAPLLRIADGLDRGHRQLVESISCQVKAEETRILVEGRPGIELDLWAAREAAAAFGEVYKTRVTIALDHSE